MRPFVRYRSKAVGAGDALPNADGAGDPRPDGLVKNCDCDGCSDGPSPPRR